MLLSFRLPRLLRLLPDSNSFNSLLLPDLLSRLPLSQVPLQFQTVLTALVLTPSLTLLILLMLNSSLNPKFLNNLLHLLSDNLPLLLSDNLLLLSFLNNNHSNPSNNHSSPNNPSSPNLFNLLSSNNNNLHNPLSDSPSS